jgi:hypothetical protein
VLPAGTLALSLTADESSLTLPCSIDGDGVPRGVCADGFEPMDGPDGYWVSFEPSIADSGAPVVFARVFRRVSAPGGVHTYGPERVDLTIFDADDRPIASVDGEPDYVLKGTERCGECQEPEAPLVLEIAGA